MHKNSLVIPVYKNSENIIDLLAALEGLHSDLNNDLEVVFVIDGSPDNSLELLQSLLPHQPYASQLLTLARNFGSFVAIRRGLEISKGSRFAVMAADLQEPVELIRNFFRLLESDDADVVLGRRQNRDDGWLNKLFSKSFWRLYGRFVIPEMPVGGVDVFACNKKFRDDLLSLRETRTSLVSQVFWIGHRRKFVSYSRQVRTKGKSAWNWSRKFRYMMDSVFSFSELPITILLWLGLFGILTSSFVSVSVFAAWMLGAISVEGYTPVMLLIGFIGSILIFGQGIIGCYVWRAMENSRNRPLSLDHDHLYFNFETDGK